MNIFSHAAVFISIILGMAIVHLLGGVSLILDARVKTKIYPIHLIWVANMLITVTLVWLSSFALAPLNNMSTLHFLNLIAYATVTNLMCGLLFPVRGEEVTDFKIHFWDNRKKFYLLGIFFVIVDALDGVFEHYYAAVPWDIGQYGTLGVWLVFFILGLKINSERFNLIIAMIYVVGLIGWLASIVDIGVLAW
ncbi:hypothetical protein ACFOSV_09000 [Algoriphagus namhaensis]|uniref:Uncharacterized protein n=1 Tax=Algoriphagus namhaensis TaxID=915353 RepID=A0ABV8ARL4_9BACT